MSKEKKQTVKVIRIAKTVYFTESGIKKVFDEMKKEKETNFSAFVNKKLGIKDGKK